jgi:class 3 adenylate cyclase/predicted ATPase
MSDIRQWLDDQGLVQYADVFEANEIGVDLLSRLTDESLEKLGVGVMGHRIRILDAIEAGAGAERPFETRTTPKTVPTKSVSLATSEAERRQITVMFCDLVGSTALSEALDAEDLLEIMAAYQKTASAVIDRYEGHVAQYLGDGLMTYFGWPTAHEDDAGRAVRAGLEILEVVKNVAAPEPLQVRIGIATGAVVVGGTGAGDASVPKAAVGETPNLAARLQEIAKPDEIVISPTTQKLVVGEFDSASLGEQAFKGIAGPLHAWKVMGERAGEGLFEARTIGGLTPLVGRESEMALLLERWDQAKDGEGQVVVLSGEPGIGKSRIIQAFRKRLADELHTRLRYQCSPYYTNTAFYPLIGQLERAAGFVREDTPEARLDKLEAIVAQSTEKVAEVAPLFAAMLSLPTERYTYPSLNPEQQKEKTFEALIEQTYGLARQSPVLMIFEDVHWIDPTTLELLNALVDAIKDEAVLLLITCRPEFGPPWVVDNYVTFHSLKRLSRRQGAEIVAEVTGGETLPDEVIDQIIAKTDGVPLFVEELTKAIVETSVARNHDRFGTEGIIATIPTTLQDSLMARLDRLDTGKEVAQIGACIGREFSFELLQGVSGLREDDLQMGLQKLVNSDLLNQRGIPPQARYTFKHALIQDAAYQSLLNSARRRLHARIAELLEQHFPLSAENEPELIALHYTGAERFDRAITYWLKAGERGMQRSANREAAENLRKGLELVPHLPEESERARRELELRAQLGPALIAVDGYGAAETASCYERALDLLGPDGDSAQLFPILYGCWVNKLTWADFPIARDMAEQFLSRARERDDTAAVLTGHRILGFSFSCLGKFGAAREQFEELVTLYQPEQHASLAYRYGQDPKAAGASMLGWNLWHLGYPDQAVRICDEAVAYARELNHANTRGYVETFGAARIRLFRGDRDGVDHYVNSVMALCEDKKLVFWLGFVKSFEGWSLIEQERYHDAIEAIQEGLSAHEEIHTSMFKPHSYALLAQAYAGCDRIDECLRVVDDALAIADQTAERWITPELLRLKGEVLIQNHGIREGAAAAEFCFEQALAIARGHEAKSWELRVATSLAQLWQKQGKHTEARELLAEVYNWFTEGFDTKDLQNAKALLEQLTQNNREF